MREHMASENVHDFDTTIGTFAHPRYELIATGEVYDGEDAVRGYYAESRTAFPDQRNEVLELHHADDTVVVEFLLLGTHLGPLRALPPTGRSFTLPHDRAVRVRRRPARRRARVLRPEDDPAPARARARSDARWPDGSRWCSTTR